MTGVKLKYNCTIKYMIIELEMATIEALYLMEVKEA